MRQYLARIGLSLALLALLVSAVAYTGLAAPQATTHVVQFPYNGPNYNPTKLLIKVGDTVEWDGPFALHPLVSEDSLWPMVNNGASFSYTFDQAGTFRYYCFFHGGPNGVGMSGMVVVMQRIFLPSLLR